MRFVSALSESAAVGTALDEVMPALDAGLGGAPDLAFAFASGRCVDGAERMLARLERAWPDAVVVGCSGHSVIGGGRELEDRSGLALVAATLPGVELAPFELDSEDRAAELPLPADAARVMLADPFSFDTERALDALGATRRGAVVGGLASGGAAPGQHALFVGGRVRRSGCVGVALWGALAVESRVAQGCRPIGQPMFVTGAHEQWIGALDGRPPLEALQELFDASPPEDQALFNGSLFLGLAMREGESSFAQGDFLVRNIAGVSEGRSELAVNAHVHEGQVVQFHLRDPRTAEIDLERALARLDGAGPARGALLFSCLGRGAALYGAPNRESECFARAFDGVPLAGFFCNGEIGPVGGRSYLHGYTAAFALFREK